MLRIRVVRTSVQEVPTEQVHLARVELLQDSRDGLQDARVLTGGVQGPSFREHALQDRALSGACPRESRKVDALHDFAGLRSQPQRRTLDQTRGLRWRAVGSPESVGLLVAEDLLELGGSEPDRLASRQTLLHPLDAAEAGLLQHAGARVGGQLLPAQEGRQLFLDATLLHRAADEV